MRKMILAAVVALVAAALAVPAFAQDALKPPKYVFVFIGDGTSFPQRNAAEFYRASKDATPDVEPAILRAQKVISKDTGITTFKPSTKRLVMNTFPAQGISTTYSSNSLITDSSSSGTAIATGRKTRDGVVGMDAEARVKFTSMAKLAKAKGKKVGIITSVSLDHATPASFYASQPSRNDYYEIALQAPATDFDYFAGGGFKQPKGKNGDQKDVFDIFKEYGYHIAKSRPEFEAISKSKGKVLAINPVLDNDEALPYTVDREAGDMSLAEFVKKGIDVLDNNEGFFMMAEGGKVDWACHANDALSAIMEVIAFDEAVEVAFDFYLQHPNDTLIVVTGDHETGGMTVGFAGTRYDTFLDRINNQQGSYLAFNEVVKKLKKDYPNATAEDVLPTIRDFFGLELHSADDLQRLQKDAAAGDINAINRMKYALQNHELEKIKKAIAMSWTEKKNRPSDDFYYMNYGSYEPLTVALTQILNNKAGIAWTTFSHSGLPTPVSAIGVGSEKFVGHYDNTDIFKKVVSIAY